MEEFCLIEMEEGGKPLRVASGSGCFTDLRTSHLLLTG